jgi:hypothetical protein
MGILAAIRSRLAGSRSTDYYGLASHGRRVPPAELAVAEAALAGVGPIAERIVAQLREAPDVWRLIADDGSYELRVSTTIDLHGVPRSGWRSRPIPVRARPGSRPLELELRVSMAGIVELHGRALDGTAWPRTWTADDGDLDAIRANAPWIDLPTPAELREQRALAVEVLEAWLGDHGALQDEPGAIAVEPPATAEAIAAFEQAQGFELPRAYRDLLLAADGFEIGATVVLGTNDAYRLDMPGPDRLVIAPPDEDGALVLAPNGELRFVEVGDETGEGRPRAPDLREWTRRRVRAAP